MKYGQVHRFGNTVALFSGTGETRYLDPATAIQLADALLALAREITAKPARRVYPSTVTFETRNIYEE